MNISPIIIVLLAVASIVVDYSKYRREPLSPLWTFALRFFLPPLYLIYLYSVIEYRTATGICEASAVAPFARVGFLLFLLPNVVCGIVYFAQWMKSKRK